MSDRVILLAPMGLDETTHPTQLGPDRAAVCKNILLGAPHGRMVRGKGQAATRDIPAQTTNVLRAFVANQRNCGKFILDYSAGGTLRLVMGDYNRKNEKPDCAGPLPDWVDVPEGGIYVKATTEAPGDVIFANAKAGRSYEVRARGLWARDPDLTQFLGNQDGEFSGATFSSTPFANNSLRGLFHVVEPGNSEPIPAGAFKVVRCTADGDLRGCFADNQGAYGDNIGVVAVEVREL